MSQRRSLGPIATPDVLFSAVRYCEILSCGLPSRNHFVYGGMNMAACPQCQGPRGQWDQQCAKCGFDYAAVDKAAAQKAALAAEAAAGCPSCAAPRAADAVECAQCGVNFAKFKEAQKRKAEAKSAPVSSPVFSDEELRTANLAHSGKVMGTIMLNLLAHTAVIFLGIATLASSRDATTTLMFVGLSAAVIVCTIGIIRWKRWALYGFLFFAFADCLALLTTATDMKSVLGVGVPLLAFISVLRPEYYYYK